MYDYCVGADNKDKEITKLPSNAVMRLLLKNSVEIKTIKNVRSLFNLIW